MEGSLVGQTEVVLVTTVRVHLVTAQHVMLCGGGEDHFQSNKTRENSEILELFERTGIQFSPHTCSGKTRVSIKVD